MRSALLSLPALLFLAACASDNQQPAVNPDPNHIHVDFAVWYEGERLDFSGEEYMSGSLEDDGHDDHEHEHRHPYLHLHDGVGHVFHSHKPGFTLRDFFGSIDMLDLFERGHTWVMFINGQQEEFTLDYVFQDLDQIFLTTSAGSAQVLDELSKMTDDACLYSKTCPERGEPPAENCVADPSVPCVAPLDDF